MERLQPREFAAAATLLSHAFLTQPNNIAIWRGRDEATRRKIETFFRIAKLERPVSDAWIARRDGEIVGVLNLVEWPRCQMSPLESLRLLPRMLTLSAGAIPRGARIQSAWSRHDPHQPHLHLGPIGVSPRVQGEGVGSRMLAKCCQMVDERKSAAYLETDRPENVPFYERAGFTVIAKETILGVPNWFMWRSPR